MKKKMKKQFNPVPVQCLQTSSQMIMLMELSTVPCVHCARSDVELNFVLPVFGSWPAKYQQQEEEEKKVKTDESPCTCILKQFR